MVYERLTNAIGDLEKDHEAVLWMIKKCTKTAKLFYNKIGQEEEIDNSRDSMMIFMNLIIMLFLHIFLRGNLSIK